MKFPEASEKDREHEGWEIDLEFLTKIQNELDFRISQYIIEAILLAAQHVIEEQEERIWDERVQEVDRALLLRAILEDDKDAFLAGVKWGQENPYPDNIDESCRQVHGFNSSKIKLETTGNGNPLWFAWHTENPNTMETNSRELKEPGPEEPRPENPFCLSK